MSLICTTGKYLNNFVHQRKVIPGNQIYVNVVATEKKRIRIIGDGHLARITKRSFRTGEECNFVILKCYRGANTNQFDYYVVPTLVDAKREIIILHIRSNDITKTNYDNANTVDLAQRIVSIAKKCRSFGVNNIAISSILIRKNVSINN